MTGDVVIHYLRLPARSTVFRQRLVHREEGCAVTLMARTPLPRPVLADGRIILEPEAPVVWFTFDGAWHDIGRFHTADGRFTGYYANVLRPVRFESPLEWSTTDLCLDVFMDPRGTLHLLDEDELDAALQAGWVDPATGIRAREEATAIRKAAGEGLWPPPVVREWTLERAQAVASASPGAAPGGESGVTEQSR
jgi:uncharacterized protein